MLHHLLLIQDLIQDLNLDLKDLNHLLLIQDLIIKEKGRKKRKEIVLTKEEEKIQL
jgi:hypothetical protein